MTERREPDDADADETTRRFIEAYKKRPDYRRELAEARRILDGRAGGGSSRASDPGRQTSLASE